MPQHNNAIDLSQADAPLQDLGLQDEIQGEAAQQGPLDENGMDRTDVPVPGQSLTNDPDAPMPFEQAPKITDVNEATQALFIGMTRENGIGQVLDLLRRELPVEDIASIFVFEMFRTGVINPDLMLLLIEPTILTLIFIADYADIEVVIHETDTMDSSKSEEGDELAAMIQKDTGGIADASLDEAPMSMGLEEAVVEQVEGEENGI